MDTQVRDEFWQAILDNDETYNHLFFYAVKTTGIFCRPSCHSRPPKRENVLVFQDANEALLQHFRPCKRCKPTNALLPEDEWIFNLTNYIHQHLCDPLTLTHLANVSHSSPYHLHRTFKKVMNMTPVQYIQKMRMQQAMDLLKHSEHSILDISKTVGYSNPSYFSIIFKKITGHTPKLFRKQFGG